MSLAGKIQPITLNDLPRFSPWPGILLGQTAFAPRRRTRKEILREYGTEKWGNVLAYLKEHPACSPEELQRQQGLVPERIAAFSEGDRLFAAQTALVLRRYTELVLSRLARHRCDTLVELGSGLGDKLCLAAARLKPRAAYGGEFTASGVECGRILARQSKVRIQFEHADFTKPATLAAIPEGALIYTSHALEQIPLLEESFVEALLRRRPRCVIHFEPGYEDRAENTLLGLMRRRYAGINDYNRNLLTVLQASAQKGRIKIIGHEPDVFGISPFNSTSILTWRPVVSLSNQPRGEPVEPRKSA